MKAAQKTSTAIAVAAATSDEYRARPLLLISSLASSMSVPKMIAVLFASSNVVFSFGKLARKMA